MAADIERLLVEWLSDQLNLRVVTELPPDLEAPETLPIVQVEEAIGPGESDPGIDLCDVDIDAYGPDRASTKDLAERIRALVMYDLPGLVFDAGATSINRTRTLRKPSRLPYDDSDLRRFGAGYRITVHSRA